MSSLERYSKPLPVFNLGVSSLQGEVERREKAKKISNLLASAVIATAKNGECFRRPRYVPVFSISHVFLNLKTLKEVVIDDVSGLIKTDFI